MLVPICRKRNLIIADRKAITYCMRQNGAQGCIHFVLAIDLRGVNRGKGGNNANRGWTRPAHRRQARHQRIFSRDN